MCSAESAHLNILAVPRFEGVQQLQPGAVGVNLQVHLTRGWCLVGLFACIITACIRHVAQVLKHQIFHSTECKKEQL